MNVAELREALVDLPDWYPVVLEVAAGGTKTLLLPSGEATDVEWPDPFWAPVEMVQVKQDCFASDSSTPHVVIQ